MKIRPVADFILLSEEQPDKVGSIELPEAYRGQRARCRVVAVGPEVEHIKPDDYVVLDKGGQWMPCDPNDDSLYLVASEYVVAVVEYEPADDVPKGLIVTAGGVS
jgi:co-chaperonin GroES (HSP10)